MSRAYSFAFWGMIIFSAIYCFVMLPVCASLSANVVYARTVIPEVMSFFAKVIEVIAISLGYAIAIYAAYRLGGAANAKIFSLYGGAAAIKCTLSQITQWWLEGGIPAFNNGLLRESLWFILLPWALEMIQFSIFFLIAKRAVKRYRGENKSLLSGGAIMPENDGGVYPVRKLNNFKNPLLRGGRVGGLVILISKVILTTIDEIYITLETRPIENLEEAITCALRYISDAICGFMAYFIIVFALIMLFDKAHKSNDEEEEEEEA